MEAEKKGFIGFSLAIKVVGNEVDREKTLYEYVNEYLKTTYDIKFVDLQRCLMKGNSIDIVSLREQIKECDACIFVYTDAIDTVGASRELYDFLFVKGVPIHFFIPESNKSIFKSSDVYEIQNKYGAEYQMKTYEYTALNLDLYIKVLNFIGLICPDEYVKKKDQFMQFVNLGIINMQTAMSGVQSVINSTPYISDAQKKELSELIEKLKNALMLAADKMPDKAKTVTNFAKIVADNLAKERPDKGILNIMANGLEEAANAVKDIAPDVVTVAMKIAEFIAAF